MPEPFRLFVPPPIATEKFLLVDSLPLHLAIPMGLVREVLLDAEVTRQDSRATVEYRQHAVSVMLGNRACPAQKSVTLVLIVAEELKSGLLAIACSTLPKIIATTQQELKPSAPLPSPWISGDKGYSVGDTMYTCVQGLSK
jgi:hypothetical protein